jgi:hypothetical protein
VPWGSVLTATLGPDHRAGGRIPSKTGMIQAAILLPDSITVLMFTRCDHHCTTF